jgi:dTDP-4-amino-4,6-dideoxygalactose transaminase
MLDLSAEIDEIWPELQSGIEEVIRSTHFINGPAVAKFESEAANYLQTNFAVGLNSGTDALVIALRACGVQPGDEVITTPFTFFATAESISNIGAVPVLVDIESDTYNIDVSKIEEKITSRSKAMIPVHLFGHACDMKSINKIAQKYSLAVIEDTAQAIGGTCDGRMLGTLSDIGTYSFFPSKNLGAFGDGGMLVTNDESFATMARTLRNHGGLNKYKNLYLGYNSRLDSIQAAILSIKLKHLDRFTELRRKAAMRYYGLLNGIANIDLPCEKPYAKHVYHQYTLRVKGGKRDQLSQKLSEQGISSVVYYPIPIHKLPVYHYMTDSLPVAEKAAEEVLSIPIGPLLSAETQKKIAEAIIEFCEN